MKPALILACCLALTACSTTPKGPIPEAVVIWHVVPYNLMPMVSVKERGGLLSDSLSTRGFFRWRDGKCHVWAPDGAEWSTLGHEVKHCFHGKFHP